jgi:hypothetical protein
MSVMMLQWRGFGCIVPLRRHRGEAGVLDTNAQLQLAGFVSDSAVFNAYVTRSSQLLQGLATARVWLDSDDSRTEAGETLSIFTEMGPYIKHQITAPDEGRVKGAHLHAIDELRSVENVLVCHANGKEKRGAIKTFTHG